MRTHEDHGIVASVARGNRTLLFALLLAACGGEPPAASASASAAPISKSEVVLAAPPTMTAGAFPCSDCHEPDLPVRTARHTLTTAHQEIVLNHGGERLWCFDCHDSKARDQLRTASGALLAYGDAHLLCGQCHGHQLRDWAAGAHGLRTGSFEGTATALRCASCHDAHAPHFKPEKPVPPPKRPRRTQ